MSYMPIRFGIEKLYAVFKVDYTLNYYFQEWADHINHSPENRIWIEQFSLGLENSKISIKKN